MTVQAMNVHTDRQKANQSVRGHALCFKGGIQFNRYRDGLIDWADLMPIEGGGVGSSRVVWVSAVHR